MANEWQKWNVWCLEDDSSLSLLGHGSLQCSKSSPPPHSTSLIPTGPSMSQISSNTMRLAGLEETAGTVWSSLIQNGRTGSALKFTLPSTFLSHRFSSLGLKWDNWNLNMLVLFSSGLCFPHCHKHGEEVARHEIFHQIHILHDLSDKLSKFSAVKIKSRSNYYPT